LKFIQKFSRLTRRLRRGPLERLSYKRENNIKTDLQETGCEGTDWIHLDQDRAQWHFLVETAMNLQIPYTDGIS